MIAIIHSIHLPRNQNRGKWFFIRLFLIFLQSGVYCLVSGQSKYSYLKLEGGLADYQEVFCSNDGEVILTTQKVENGMLTYILLDGDNLKSNIQAAVPLPLETEDKETGVFVLNMHKFNGDWYLHLKGTNEYIIQCDFRGNMARTIYASKTMITMTHQDFYVNDTGCIYLYKWTSGESVRNAIEVNRVDGQHLKTVFALSTFVPEGLVGFSMNYRCIAMRKNDVFVMDPATGAVIRYGMLNGNADTVRRACYSLSKEQEREIVRLAKKYKRINSYKIFNELIQFENDLVHYEKLKVLNDSIFVLNSFSYEKGNIRDSLIYYNFRRRRVQHVFRNSWNFKDSIKTDINWYYLYYRKWSICNNDLFVLSSYAFGLDDPGLLVAGQLLRSGSMDHKYLWAVKQE